MTKKTKKVTIIICCSVLGILAILYGVYSFARMLSPGSYPFAEGYSIKYSENDIITAVELFKSRNPEYQVPLVTISNSPKFELKDGRNDGKVKDYWYHIYFYYARENKILHTWTRPNDNKTTEFAFDAVNDGLELGHWKNVNDDYSYSENKIVLKTFEDRILNPILSILNNETNLKK
jgi:hypothetical protein